MWWWVGREMKGVYSGSLFYLEKGINTDLVVAELSYFFLQSFYLQAPLAISVGKHSWNECI